MNEFWYFVISGGIVMFVPVFVVAYFQGGFFAKWLKVKTSRGKKVLIKLRRRLLDDYEVGVLDGDFIIYGKKENKKRLVIPEDCIYRSFGVNVVDLHDGKQAIAKTDFEAVSGHDGERYESLYIRALYRPSLMENNQKILMILLIVVLCALGISLFFSWNITQQLSAISNVGSVTSLI